MATFKSTEYCSENNNGYEGLFTHDRGSEQIIIKDNLISDDTVGQARARAELLKGGYVERWVSITKIHTPNLKQNDIITYRGLNWIVKEITLSFTAPVLTQLIKGLRYE